jgi:N-acetylglucosaminyldiphosphoundecaprenol N-acetyl-beta-D-mannosaminyltransferase
MTGATDWIVSRAASGPAAQVAFVNPACLNAAREDPAYRDALAGCERVYADGIGIHLACRLLGLRLAENVNGTDLFPRLCEALASSGRSVYLLGARPGVAAAAAEAMARRVPRLIIAGTRHGYFPPEDTDAVIDAINRSGADVLLVAFGAPAQELWLARHRARLAPSIRIGVGGLFDFYSGRIPRAPRWLQELGLEWVWRLVQEPRRMWRRYLVGNPLFLWRVMRQRIAGGE